MSFFCAKKLSLCSIKRLKVLQVGELRLGPAQKLQYHQLTVGVSAHQSQKAQDSGRPRPP